MYDENPWVRAIGWGLVGTLIAMLIAMFVAAVWVAALDGEWMPLGISSIFLVFGFMAFMGWHWDRRHS